MVSVAVFEFCGVRCQPLRRALVFIKKIHNICANCFENQLLVFKVYELALVLCLMLIR
nr:acetyltransferase [Vibrio sp. gvc]